MMNRINSLPLAALVLCLAVSFPAAGQTPAPPPAPTLAIDGPTTVQVYSLGRYAVKGDPAAKVAWMVLPAPSRVILPPPSQLVIDQGLVLTGQPGPYTVLAFAISGGRPVILQQSISIAGPAPAPDPPPVPSPAPDPIPAPAPKPVPISGPLWVTAIYDYSNLQNLPAGQRDLRTSSTIGPALRAMDATWRNFDKNTAVGADWVARFPDVPLPFVVIQTSSTIIGGKPIPLPAYESNLTAIVDAIRRGN